MSYILGISNIVNAALLNGGKILNGEAECTDVQIKGNYIIFQTDNPVFKNSVIDTVYKAGAQRQICDYVIISDNVVLICELKSNNEGNMKTQLKNTGKFVKYLLEMAKAHNSITSNIPPIKYVCFAKKYSGVKQKAIANKLNGIQWHDSELFQLSCSSKYHLNQFN